jgi:hypothetical protein
MQTCREKQFVELVLVVFWNVKLVVVVYYGVLKWLRFRSNNVINYDQNFPTYVVNYD